MDWASQLATKISPMTRPSELQVFRLPVLRDVDREAGRGDELAESDLLEAVDDLLIVVFGDTGQRLPDQGRKKDDSEKHCQAVIA